MDEEKILSLERQKTINKQETQNLLNRKKLILKRQTTIKNLERLYTLNLRQPKRVLRTISISQNKIKPKIEKNLIFHTPFLTETTRESNTARENYNHTINDINNDNNKENNNNNNNTNDNNTIDNNNTIENNNNTIDNNNNDNNNNNKSHFRKSITLSNKTLNILQRGKTINSQKYKNFVSKSTINAVLWKKQFKTLETLNPRLYRKKDMALNGSKQILHVKKKTNPLEIAEEDKIFAELNDHINKYDLNEKTHYRNFHSENLNENQKILNDMYHFSPDFYDKIYFAKKKKKILDLEKYQNNLLLTISDSISQKSYKKLEKSFIKIRDQCFVDIENNGEFIKGVEKKEKKIIKKINNTNKECVEIFRKTFTNFKLPKVKFRRIIKKNKKKNVNFIKNDSESSSQL